MNNMKPENDQNGQNFLSSWYCYHSDHLILCLELVPAKAAKSLDFGQWSSPRQITGFSRSQEQHPRFLCRNPRKSKHTLQDPEAPRPPVEDLSLEDKGYPQVECFFVCLFVFCSYIIDITLTLFTKFQKLPCQVKCQNNCFIHWDKLYWIKHYI